PGSKDLTEPHRTVAARCESRVWRRDDSSWPEGGGKLAINAAVASDRRTAKVENPSRPLGTVFADDLTGHHTRPSGRDGHNKRHEQESRAGRLTAAGASLTATTTVLDDVAACDPSPMRPDVTQSKRGILAGFCVSG